MSREWVTMRFCPSFYTCRLERQYCKKTCLENILVLEIMWRDGMDTKNNLCWCCWFANIPTLFALVPSITISISASHQLLRLRSLRSDGILRKVSWIQMATGWVLSGTPFPPADWTQEHSKPDPSSNYLRDVIELEVNVGEAKSGESSIAVNVKLN